MSIKVTTLVWQNYSGSGTELLTMLALADWCDDQGDKLFPSIKAVAKKLRISESQARRSVHKLIDQGYLTVVKNHDGGRNSETRHYKIDVILLHVPLNNGTKKRQKVQEAQARVQLKPVLNMARVNESFDDFDNKFTYSNEKETADIN